jgi:S-adenosylmethionine synthetase
VVISTHHRVGVSSQEIDEGVRELVIGKVLPTELVDKNTKVYVNPSGRFEVGGPTADAGLTGRKIIVDTYGGVARHGGGAFSGKDPSKVDRSAAYAARYVAKNLVAAGLAERCEAQVSYAIGRAQPTSIAVETFDTARAAEDDLLRVVREQFDLRPRAIIDKLDLLHPIYQGTAAYGHFGRDDLRVPWERTDQADALRESGRPARV